MAGRNDTPRIHVAHRLLRARDWQDRAQFARLCDWWRSGAGGVCALVGIGGAGKTAIADRFVRSLPGVLADPDVAVDESLRPPRGLFVFSFYDAPNPDAFFAELAAWLDDAAEGATVSYERTVRRLEREEGVLLVLDGLEKVQDTGERTGWFGRLLDNRLRDLVLRAAEGLLPGVRLLITSRFQLFDPLAERSPRFWQIAVEELTPEASVALLRQRGVRGPDHRLVAMARDQGFHALSVDLAGGYVARFLDGDPARLEPEPVVPTAGAGVDPRVAALRQQERRFARLAERYAEALRAGDPAALALLQRVCLFRLGVGTATLASIFTGEGKGAVAGAELARLDETGLRAKLALLTEMKLLERDDNERYSVHPAVRDGFVKTLDEQTSRQGHEAAREGLSVALGDRPGANPSDPATLDLLEEIVHHTLAAGHVEEAWDVYESRIGGYENLGWRLGAYERGERICRAFAGGRPPEDAPLPEGLSEARKAIFVNEWALYLKDLGRLDAAARCYERSREASLQREHWTHASANNQNLTEVLVLAGRLTAASESAEEALRLAERADDAHYRCFSHAFRAHVRALRGETSGALDDFRDAHHWQHEAQKKPERPLWSLRGVLHTLLLARLGQNEEATRLTEVNKEILREEAGLDNFHEPFCNLVLADLARQRRDLDAARRLLDAAHEWAIARDAKELLCWAALVRARLEPDGDDARRAVEDGLRIARDCGFGIYHVDLLLERARLALDEDDAERAIADLDVALFASVRPPEDSRLPELLAATDPDCGYAWGEAAGRHLRAEALLLQAARRLGRGDFAPARFDELPADARGPIDEARQELETCRRLQRKIQDPKVADTEDVLAQLDGGVLTRRPLTAPTDGEPTSAASTETSSPEKEKPSVTKKHVFLSYVRESFADVERLRDDLIRSGETVWWDQDIPPGANWKLAIHQALGDAYAFVLCLSKEMEGRDVSGAFPEIRDAIDIHRQRAPLGAFIFPVRLSGCEMPFFQIDSTTMLEDLQRVDLFPDAERPEALSRLVAALAACPGHP
ncbi:MAG: TIR domain-containing protein [Thermoanaerobaculia bacterium]